MYAFPAVSDLGFLVGKELAQVALDPQGVQFRWEQGGQISAWFEIEHIDDQGHQTRYDGIAFTGPPLLLHRLLQRIVSRIESVPLLLTLHFDDGQRLMLHSQEGPYECGMIQLGRDMADGFIIY